MWCSVKHSRRIYTILLNYITYNVLKLVDRLKEIRNGHPGGGLETGYIGWNMSLSGCWLQSCAQLLKSLKSNICDMCNFLYI